MKTIKTAISMPEDLYLAVRTRAGDKPFSTTMCDLIRQALGFEVIPTQHGITETSIYEQLRELTARIEAIEQRIVIPVQDPAEKPGAAPVSITEVIPESEQVQPEVIPAVIPEKESQTIPDQPDHHLTTRCPRDDEQVKSDSVHDFIEYNNNVHTKKSTCSQKNYTSTIQITPEIRHILITKLDSLQSRGLTYRHIAETAGLASKGRITEIRNGKCKSLKESEYQALMSM